VQKRGIEKIGIKSYLSKSNALGKKEGPRKKIKARSDLKNWGNIKENKGFKILPQNLSLDSEGT